MNPEPLIGPFEPVDASFLDLLAAEKSVIMTDREQKLQAAMGSMMAIVPVLAGFTAIPLFNEPLSVSLSLALLLVSVGVWLANANTIRKRQPHSPAGERHALYQYQNHIHPFLLKNRIL